MVAVDRDFSTDRLPDDTRLARIAADLRDPGGAWRASIDYVDAIVHLAAQHPYPDASWADCVASVDMTLNLVNAAAPGLKRFVFASSNHVMGGYKETPFATKAGSLKVDLDPRPGTSARVGGVLQTLPAYAVAKLMGERILAAKAEADGLEAVSLRVGWCQPGANHPSTISASGVPGAEPDAGDTEAAHDLRWFRQMWLSDTDFCGLVEAAMRADATAWPSSAIVVNAMSGNAGTPWDLTPARTLLGYRTVDDVWRALGLEAPL